MKNALPFWWDSAQVLGHIHMRIYICSTWKKFKK